MNVKDKVIAITGASGGLGRHFALTLAAHGARIAACARRLPLLQELEAQIKSAGGSACAVELDVTSKESAEAAYSAIESALGAPPNVLINNSGLTANAAWLDQTESDWDQVLDTNLKGAFLMSSAFGRRWKAAARPGAIINIASILGLRQAGGVGPYAVSKSGLIQMTKTMAFELAREGIQVNSVSPGPIATAFNLETYGRQPGKMETMAARVPVGRFGEPREVAEAIVFLATLEGQFIAGHDLVVDGGYIIL